MNVPFDVEEFRAAIDARDTERIHAWIDVDPLEARAELQRVGDYAKAHADIRAVAMQDLRAASFAGTIGRAEYEQALADHKAWKRANEGFVRVVGRLIQRTQLVQAAQKRERHDVVQAAADESFGARIGRLEDRVEELEALVARLTQGVQR